MHMIDMHEEREERIKQEIKWYGVDCMNTLIFSHIRDVCEGLRIV